ncbi:hypothetical protein [Escherichia coli]|uniref:hypothetical protein n=1 Tax=Escherichia coli TaxID=562 RepID=UPI00259CF73D|nr:hypothetical protein [Escherichia coli]MDM4882514.1 hypothetical protein [Escherichia coli]
MSAIQNFEMRLSNIFLDTMLVLAKLKFFFSVENPYKLALFFDFAKKGVEVAKAIMGLLDRNDIEITMYRATDSSPQSVKSIKLRKSEDVEKCKDLLSTCVAIGVQRNKEKEGSE